MQYPIASRRVIVSSYHVAEKSTSPALRIVPSTLSVTEFVVLMTRNVPKWTPNPSTADAMKSCGSL
jgi:hypothetical protein